MGDDLPSTSTKPLRMTGQNAGSIPAASTMPGGQRPVETHILDKPGVLPGPGTRPNKGIPMAALLGRKIVSVSYLPAEEFGFDCGHYIVVLILDDGTEIFAMQDEEGNGSGVLMHRTQNGDEYVE